MLALVTGSRGFVGPWLRDHLAAAGDTVVELDRALGSPDIVDRDATLAFIAEHSPDVVYHLAGLSHVPRSFDDPISTLQVNVLGTQNVLDGARLAGAQRALVVTSAAVYGAVDPAHQPIAETQPFAPTSPYAASKAAADVMAQQAWLSHGFEAIRARPFNHIGPGQTANFVAAGLAERIVAAERSGADAIAVGNLTARRDFTDVRDVVRAYRGLITDGRPGEAYNICTGVDVAIQELAERLLAMADIPLTLEIDPELVRSIDTSRVRGDASKIRSDTGWNPTIDLETTLRDLLDEKRGASTSGPPADSKG
ncbi:MAG: NAD-dependent epimerase/dehydratase family protein [Acidimicrobiales bacterium]|nr:NAD-dependent epimerase/dehydratase family protein [Acidimicrobiales bacterium]